MFKFHFGTPWPFVGADREEKDRVYFSSSPCRHNQQNMAVLCRHVVTSMARGGTFGESVFLRPSVTSRVGRWKRPLNSQPPPGYPLSVSSAEVWVQLFESNVVYTLWFVWLCDVGVTLPLVMPPPLRDHCSYCIRKDTLRKRLTQTRRLQQAWYSCKKSGVVLFYSQY